MLQKEFNLNSEKLKMDIILQFLIIENDFIKKKNYQKFQLFRKVAGLKAFA